MIIKCETESEWLVLREPNINSTDLAALFGLSEYKSRLKLWLIKKGLIEDDFIETPFTVWGRRLQNAIGAGICEDNGWQCEDLTGLYMVDKELRYGSSLDVKAICEDRGEGIFEVKRTGAISKEFGWTQKTAPVDYEFQIQGQLDHAEREKTPIKWGCIGVMGGHSDTKVYERKRDANLRPLIETELDLFWRSIHDNVQPAPDYKVDGAILAKLRGPIRQDDVINLSFNPKAVELVTEYDRIKNRMARNNKLTKPLKDRQTAIKEELLQLMGRNASAKIGDFTIKAPEIVIEESVRYETDRRNFYLTKRKRA